MTTKVLISFQVSLVAIGLSLNPSSLRADDGSDEISSATDKAPGDAPSSERSAAGSRDLDELIAQLASDRFAEREAASRELAETGKPAVARLTEAFEGDDPEIRMRAQFLLFHILPETQPRGILSLGPIGDDQRIVIEDGVYEQILIEELNGNAVIDSAQIEVGEIRIGSINGLAKLAIKGKAKSLRIGSINGVAQIDTSGLESGDVEVGDIGGAVTISLHSLGAVKIAGSVSGGTKVTIDALGDVAVEEGIKGGARVEVLAAKDLTIGGPTEPGITLSARFSGVATCPDSPGNISLTKIDAPE